MNRGQRLRTAACASTVAVVAGLLGLPSAGAATTATPAPVSPVEAVRITEQLATQAPALPASVRALLAQRAGTPAPAVPAAVMAKATAIIADFNRTGRVATGPGGENATKLNGRGCAAQGFTPNGKPTVRETDTDRNGKIDPWEEDVNKNETCLDLGVLPYDSANPDKGSFVLERRTETDAVAKKTYTRHALRWNYVVEADAHGAHGAPCVPTSPKKLINATRDALQKYKNNPALLKQDGYWPFPIGNTKTYHWFHADYAGLNDKDYQTSETILDPTKVEMFTMALTDDGYVPFNVAYMYTYDGDKKGGPSPTAYDANKDKKGTKNNNGAGCLVKWHGHTGDADGTATGNLEDRTWMAHLQFYGGTTRFDKGEEWDGAEPHGWLTALQNVPAAVNSEGTGF